MELSKVMVLKHVVKSTLLRFRPIFEAGKGIVKYPLSHGWFWGNLIGFIFGVGVRDGKGLPNRG